MSLKLSTLADGAVEERFAIEVRRILENIADPNTDAKKKRKLQLTLTFEPNEDRSLANLQIDTKVTTAPAMGVNTSILMGFDGDGAVAGREIMQTRLFDDEEQTSGTEGTAKVSYMERKQSGRL